MRGSGAGCSRRAPGPTAFDKAAASGADVSIIDLEDSVAPGDKGEARRAALTHLSQPAAGSFGRALRINALVTRAGLAASVHRR